MAKSFRLLHAVQQVLFLEWDPIGVHDNDECHDEYNSYVPEIVGLLLSGVDESKLASRLSELQRVSMGLSESDEELHRRVARRLLGFPTPLHEK